MFTCVKILKLNVNTKNLPSLLFGSDYIFFVQYFQYSGGRRVSTEFLVFQISSRLDIQLFQLRLLGTRKLAGNR